MLFLQSDYPGTMNLFFLGILFILALVVNLSALALSIAALLQPKSHFLLFIAAALLSPLALVAAWTVLDQFSGFTIVYIFPILALGAASVFIVALVRRVSLEKREQK